MPKEKKKALTIQSVERAFSILECLLRTGRAMSVVEICGEVQIQRTTLYALLNTLISMGYVVKLPREGKFMISSKVYELSAPYPSRLPIVQYISPRLMELGRQFDTAVHIAIPNHNGKFIPVLVSGALQNLIVQSSSGGYPLHATSTGKLILSYMEDERIRITLETEGLPQYTNATITKVETIWDELKIIRQQGYAVDHSEYFPDIMCFSLPISDAERRLLAVITLSGSVTHMNKIRDELISAGLQCSRIISMEITDAIPSL